MKWNVLFGSLVLTMGICTQGFSAGLLDRMLGVSGCCGSSCCEASCGAAAACCDNACVDTCCDSGCNVGSSCCGLNRCGRGCGLFSGLFKSHHCGCNSCCETEPTCGVAADTCCNNACPTTSCCEPSGCCDTGCASGCGHGCGKRGLLGCGLFDGLFRGRGCCGCAEPTCGVVASDCCNRGCCEPTCGSAAVSGGEPAPTMPPAPVVDPSAYKAPGKLRVIKASHTASFGRWSKR